MWKTDGWFRRHAVTAWATIVEVGLPRHAGQNTAQPVTLDVVDPGSGATARVTGELSVWVNDGEYVAGQRLRVRYAPETGDITEFRQESVPKDEWLYELNHPGGTGISVDPATVGGSVFPAAPGTGFANAGDVAVQVVNTSHADPATVRAKLEKVRAMGLISEEQVEQAMRQLGAAAPAPASGLAPGTTPPVAGGLPTVQQRLAALDQLHRSGAITDAEHAAQRQRILDCV